MRRPADRQRQLRTLRTYVTVDRSAKVVAEQLGMTTRQVYRDLETLRILNNRSTLGLAYWLGRIDQYEQQPLPWPDG